jgi:hypothetical protein
MPSLRKWRGGRPSRFRQPKASEDVQRVFRLFEEVAQERKPARVATAPIDSVNNNNPILNERSRA